MFRKRILIILLLFSIVSLFSQNGVLQINLNNWEREENYFSNNFNLGLLDQYKKSIRTTHFELPEKFNNRLLYLKVERHLGLSYIYLNNKLISNIGSYIHVKNSDVSHILTVGIPPSLLEKSKPNKLQVVSYGLKKSKIPKMFISSVQQLPWYISFYKWLKQVQSLTYTLLIIVFIFSYAYFRKNGENLSNYLYLISLILFLMHFLLNGLEDSNLLKDNLSSIKPILSLLAWLLFILYHTVKRSVWETKQILTTSVIIGLALLSLSVSYSLHIKKIGINEVINTLLFITNLGFLLILLKKPMKDSRILNTSVIISLVLHLGNIIMINILHKPDFGLASTAIISVLIGYYITHFKDISDKIESNKLYSSKLFDTIEKNKLEISRKEHHISELKNINEEITRDKAIFFTTLGRNLRAPLNSIIGYSETIYTTDDITEVAPLVTEIIIEADKIFQAINNIMDFSTRDFNNNDLLLKDFRMKEIFDNSVYASPLISSFKKQINYKSVGVTDKVLIKGNPLIYKQMVTNILQFLISLNPKDIEYEISNNGITEKYMNLDARFIAHNLQNTDSESITPISNGKDIFTKYIKLYDVKFHEEFNDNDYIINIKFQCGLSDDKTKTSIPNLNVPTKHFLDKNITVLVVEDYLPNLNIVKLHLTKMGCNVLTATNGEDAITLFEKEFVDVILMDIKMPIMDGWEATERIRSTEKGLDTLIVGLTASSLDLDIRHCFESGMDDVQVKPIRKNQLYNKLESLETFKPQEFPTIASLRADYGISKVETETLFTSTINQISKQLEVLEVLISAADDVGIKMEIPVLLHAAAIINAFYFARLIRNFDNAYNQKDHKRVEKVYKRLVETINRVKEDNSDIFRN